MASVSPKVKSTRVKRTQFAPDAPPDPLVPYCVWKLHRSTLDGLKVEAEERGATVAGLVRKVLGDWVKARQKKDPCQI